MMKQNYKICLNCGVCEDTTSSLLFKKMLLRLFFASLSGFYCASLVSLGPFHSLLTTTRTCVLCMLRCVGLHLQKSTALTYAAFLSVSTSAAVILVTGVASTLLSVFGRNYNTLNSWKLCR
jgi:hypothetical protein